jgi:hypothetical protein
MLRKMTVCGMVALSLVFATRVNSLFGEDGLSSPQPKTSGPNGPPLTQQIHETLKELEKSREIHNGLWVTHRELANLKSFFEESQRFSRSEYLNQLKDQLKEMERLSRCPVCRRNHSGSSCPLWQAYVNASLNRAGWPSYCFSTYRPEASKEGSSSKAYYGLAGAGAAAAAGGLFGRRKEKQ